MKIDVTWIQKHLKGRLRVDISGRTVAMTVAAAAYLYTGDDTLLQLLSKLIG